MPRTIVISPLAVINAPQITNIPVYWYDEINRRWFFKTNNSINYIKKSTYYICTKSYIHIFQSESSPFALTRLAGRAIGSLDKNSKLQQKQFRKRTIPSHEGTASTIQCRRCIVLNRSLRWSVWLIVIGYDWTIPRITKLLY